MMVDCFQILFRILPRIQYLFQRNDIIKCCTSQIMMDDCFQILFRILPRIQYLFQRNEIIKYCTSQIMLDDCFQILFPIPASMTKNFTRNIKPLLSLVNLLHCWALIGQVTVTTRAFLSHKEPIQWTQKMSGNYLVQETVKETLYCKVWKLSGNSKRNIILQSIDVKERCEKSLYKHLTIAEWSLFNWKQ